MAGAPLNPFQGGMVESGLMIAPSIISGIPYARPIGLVLVGPSPLHTLLLVCYPLVVAPLHQPWFILYLPLYMGALGLLRQLFPIFTPLH